MKTKDLTVEFKADGDGENGQFTAYAAVFGNKDSYGDVIVPGAFRDSLAEYGLNGEGIPIYWGHRVDDVFLNLGATLTAEEDSHGLLIRGQLDLDEAAATRAHKLIKAKRVRQLSFGYTVVEAAWVESEEHGLYYELRKIKIHEISIVPIGANQETGFLGVKAAAAAVEAEVHAGRTISPAEEAAIKGAHDALGRVLATTTDQSKAAGPADANAEEPATANAEEPKPSTHAKALAVSKLISTF